MRIFVLRGGALGLAGRAIVKIIAGARVSADAVLMIQADVEPDRRVKRAVLIQAKPGQFVVKNFRRLGIGKITVRHSPIRNRSRHAMNELAH